MGACWILDKQIIPILFNGVTYLDMKGFIDNHRIALDLKNAQPQQLYMSLRPFIKKDKTYSLEKNTRIY